MPRVLIVQHAAQEGPGLLADWLAEAGLSVQVTGPASLPDRADALVLLGGPMSAADVCRDWPAEVELLAAAVREEVPVLAICLGAQLLAVACGGTVRPGQDGPELGPGLVRRADAASRDPVFAGVPLLPEVVQWHWDEIAELPPGAVALAGGARYPHQAFRVGRCAYGLQFHLEVTPPMLAAWADAEGLDPEPLLAELAQMDLADTWRGAVEQWAALAGAPGRSGG